MKKDAIVFLRHIFDSILKIEKYTEKIEYNDFIKSDLI